MSPSQHPYLFPKQLKITTNSAMFGAQSIHQQSNPVALSKQLLRDTSTRQCGTCCHRTIGMAINLAIEVAAFSGGRRGHGQLLLAGFAPVGLLRLLACHVLPLLLPQRCRRGVHGCATTPAQVSLESAPSMLLTPMNLSQYNARKGHHAQEVRIRLIALRTKPVNILANPMHNSQNCRIKLANSLA